MPKFSTMELAIRGFLVIKMPFETDDARHSSLSAQDFSIWSDLAGNEWRQALYSGIGSEWTRDAANTDQTGLPEFRVPDNSLPFSPNSDYVNPNTATPDYIQPAPLPEGRPLPASDWQAQNVRVQTQDNNPDFIEGARRYQQGDYRGAFAYMMKAAQAGDAWAQTQVGLFFEQGTGVQQDYSQAARWYRQAAENPVCAPEAMKNLGQLYEYGAGVSEDWTTAAQWYQRGAALGNASSETALARAYQFGVGVPQDRQQAIFWQQRAINDGDSSGAEWIKQIANPNNFIGFRTDEEQNIVLSTLSTNGMLVGGDPEGMTFHNNSERLQWIRQFRDSMNSGSAASSGFYRRSSDPGFFDPRTRN